MTAHTSNSDRISRGHRIKLPLTCQQLWWREVMRPRELMRLMTNTFVIQISGLLDIQLLRMSIRELICRHDSLRCRIFLDEVLTGQHIDYPTEIESDVVDI